MAVKANNAKKPKHEVFQMFRTVGPKMESYNGFVWEEGKTVVAPDYNSRAECGGGLHGLKNGLGNWALLNWDPEAVGIIFENVDCPVIDIDGDKVKVQKARIIEKGPLPALLAKFLPNFIGELVKIVKLITVDPKAKNDPLTTDKANAKIGSSGDYAQIGSSGESAQIGSSGFNAKIGSSGENSVVCNAGLNGKAKIGKNGALALTYKDDTGRYRIAVGYEGENLKADTWYLVNSKGEFVEVP